MWGNKGNDNYRESGGKESEGTHYAVARDGASEPAGSPPVDN